MPPPGETLIHPGFSNFTVVYSIVLSVIVHLLVLKLCSHRMSCCTVFQCASSYCDYSLFTCGSCVFQCSNHNYVPIGPTSMELDAA